MKPVPILFLSDNPILPTGLARITKDLAVHLTSLPEFRVGTIGRGGLSSTKLPFFNAGYDERWQWGEEWIEDVWNDFAGVDPGIIMTIWDLSRLDWFSRPKMGGSLQAFLSSGRFKKWAYIPVDHYGIGEQLTSMMADTASGFDRILAYTIFGKKVLENTLQRDVDWIPHGINGDIFQPRDPLPGRAMLTIDPREELIGCVMANQARKDWGTAFGAASFLAKQGRKFWFHTDTFVRDWDLLALAKDFSLESSLIITTQNFSSEQLSCLYSACDVTFLPSLGEGFGFPIVESLACGVPVVHGNFGGGVELIPERDWLVERIADRLDTRWNCIRPVWSPKIWAGKIEHVLGEYSGTSKDICVNSIEHLKWKNLWPSCWQKWFMEGIQ